MARTVTVTLQAVVAGYQRNVAKAAAETRALRSEMSQLPGLAARNSQAFTAAGLALGAAGAAMVLGLRSAAKESAAFEARLTKSTTLIGISRDEMDRMGQSALRLSDTGKGPQELADALFFAQSAGLRGADAMAVVEASAKAASIGLGDTATVTDVVTSAVNAYGIENLTAAQATDTLIGVVRAGKAEPAELAGAFGRVLPIASEMGVRFDEVGAAVAAMTRTGTDARTSTTQLRAVLASLLKPAQQSEQALGDLGLSSQMLRDTIREDGLWAALEMLRGAIGDNEEALGKILPNQRALAGFLSLTGANAAENAAIFADLTDTTGLLAEGFAEWSRTTEAAQSRFSAAMEAAKISLGESFQAPMRAALDTGTGLLQLFIELPGPMKTVVGLGSGVAGVGLTLAGGFLLAAPRIAATKAAMADLSQTMPHAVGAVRAMGSVLRPIAPLFAVGTIALMGWANAKAEARRTVEEFVAAIEADTGALGQNTRELAVNKLQQEDAFTAAEKLGISRGDLVNALLGEEDATRRVNSVLGEYEGAAVRGREATGAGRNAWLESADAADDVRRAVGTLSPQIAEAGTEFRENAEAAAEAEGKFLDVAHAIKGGLSPEAAAIRIRLQEYREEAETAGGATDDLGGDFDDLTGEIQDADQALNDYKDTLRKMTDPVFRLESALSDVEQAQADYTDAVKEYGAESVEAREASFRLMQRLEDLEQAAINGDLSFKEFDDRLDRWVKRGDITKEQADQMRARVKDLRLEAEDFDDDYTANIKETGYADVKQKLATLGQAVMDLPSGKTIKLTVEGDTTWARVGPGGRFFSAQGGPIDGPGTSTSDSIPGWLSDGEYVMRAKAREKYGDRLMAAINAGLADVSIPGAGGPISQITVKHDADLSAADFHKGLNKAIGEFAGQVKSAGSLGKGRVLPRGSYRIGRGSAAHGYGALDLPAPTGTPVGSVAPGIVTRAARLATSYGIHAFVNHPGGRHTRYAHLSSLAVRLGQKVGSGQQLGRVGSTGNSTGPHLHYEDWLGGRRRMPERLGIFDGGGVVPPRSLMANTSHRPEALLTERQWRTLTALLTLPGRDGAEAPTVFNVYGTSEELIAKVQARQAYARIARSRVRS